MPAADIRKEGETVTEARPATSDAARGTLGTVRNAVLLLDLLSDGPAYQQLTDLAERSPGPGGPPPLPALPRPASDPRRALAVPRIPPRRTAGDPARGTARPR